MWAGLCILFAFPCTSGQIGGGASDHQTAPVINTLIYNIHNIHNIHDTNKKACHILWQAFSLCGVFKN